jgi:hypothetical protein
MSVAFTTDRSANARSRSSAAKPATRVHSATYGDAGSCAWRPASDSIAGTTASDVGSSRCWRASVARFSSADVRTATSA